MFIIFCTYVINDYDWVHILLFVMNWKHDGAVGAAVKLLDFCVLCHVFDTRTEQIPIWPKVYLCNER